MKTFLRALILLAITISILTIISCEKNKKGNFDMSNFDKISPEEWQVFSQRHIIFGHQSVGSDILSGVKELVDQAGVSIQLTESKSSGTSIGITHFKIGQNEDPYSKIKDFERITETDIFKKVDIAMMKLCFVDISSRSDVVKLANDYIESLDRLSFKFPNTIFVAVTVPLTTVQSGPKASIKRLLRRTPDGYVENIKRNEFNELVRKRYSKSGNLFDLAKFEAEGSNIVKYQGNSFEVLNPALTSDGGHLNQIGQRLIATKLIKFISGLKMRSI